MIIRPVQLDDVSEWLRMRVALWPDTDPDEEANEIAHFLAVPPRPPLPTLHAAFVCPRPDGGLCGLVEVSIHHTAPGCETDRIGYLEAWYVDPDWRGRGVGRALVERAETWAKAEGCLEMASDTNPSYPLSPQAHAALGYEETERYFRKELIDTPTSEDKIDVPLKQVEGMETELLLVRLDEIGQSLERSHHALALIGLGSVGVELERLDAYSDLDFFVIVEPGYKRAYLNDLHWLSAINPIAYHFPNTEDGYKLLFADGIFCEFAVFEPEELLGIPFAAGRVVWKQPQVPETISQPRQPQPTRRKPDQEWLLGEVLTNLYVGLAREGRGERLSALRFIQGYAVDRLVELADFIETAQPVFGDPFAPERRFEQRYKMTASHAAAWLQGYERNKESALAILSFLEQHFPLNQPMCEAIKSMALHSRIVTDNVS